MSTHPRDFPTVEVSCKNFEERGLLAIPCYGAHPWFLHDITTQEDEIKDDYDALWINELRERLENNPKACVGEIGLDGIRWNEKPGQLATSIPKQQKIFECQLKIAAEYDRPVSIHVVQAWGPLFQSLKRVKQSNVGLPKSMYFHAFAGKSQMTYEQLVKACHGSTLYFGFAPIINFRSPKTKSVMECIGLESLLLESDLENSDYVIKDLGKCANFIADVFHTDLHDVLNQTYENAKSFYRIDSP